MRFLSDHTGIGRPRYGYAGVVLGLLFTVCVGGPARAYAAPSDHITLELSAPDDCVDQRAILDAVDARFGDELDTDTQLHASAHIQQLSAAVYQLDLRYQTRAGAEDARSLRGESCAAVADALTFLLSLALSPRAAPAVVEHTREPGVSLGFALFGALDSAVMSRLAFGLGIMLGLRVGPLELFARAQLFLPRTASESGAVTTFEAFSGDLGLCRPFRWSSVELAPCARAELGQLSGKVQGAVVDERPGAARFQALALGAALRVRLAAPLWLMVSADLAWFLRRPSFVVDPLGEVSRPHLLGTRVVLGPLLTW